MNNILTPGFGHTSSDDYFVLQNSYDPRDGYEKNVYRWDPPIIYNYAIGSNDWSEGYTAVFNANYCLEMIEKIPVTSQNETAWKNVKGSALFYRAYNFLNLVWQHGKAYDEASSTTDLGIVLRLGSDFNVPSVRSSVKECYDRVISDATEAISYLPDNPIHPYRPSKAAAYGLLARAYLSMRKYDVALNYSTLCLQIRNALIDFKGDPEFKPTTSNQNTMVPFNKETIFYSEMNIAPFGTGTASRAKIDTQLFQSYASNDIRKTGFFTSGPPAVITPWGTVVYSFRGSYSGSTSFFTGIATDEMYLIRAECYARKGDKTSAMNDVTALLTKRYAAGFVVPNPPDAAAALNLILIERRKELIFRGLRWIDIKRLNKEGANIILERLIKPDANSPITSYKLLPNANYYALPLPTDIINITGVPQNPF